MANKERRYIYTVRTFNRNWIGMIDIMNIDISADVAREAESEAKFWYQQHLRDKINELGGVRLDYGHFAATTYIKGNAISIEDRYKQLQTLLKESEEL